MEKKINGFQVRSTLFPPLSWDKTLKRRDECIVGGQRKKADGVCWWWKYKNKAVVANKAIRALCCSRALSFGYSFPEKTRSDLKMVSSKEKQTHIPAPCNGTTLSPWIKYEANYELYSLIKPESPLIKSLAVKSEMVDWKHRLGSRREKPDMWSGETNWTKKNLWIEDKQTPDECGMSSLPCYFFKQLANNSVTNIFVICD